ncbi:MAG: MBL fold metallo-hydrolase [Saprospiraceae bacterium]|nr:MBL fold metallo-hydrolase [Saprospiraceae bacterium]
MRVFLYIAVICLFGCSSGKENTVISTEKPFQLIQFTHKNTNIYLLKKDKRAVLIDAGYESTYDRIEGLLTDHNVSTGELDHVIITHAHADHAGSAYQLQKNYNCKVIAGRADSAYIVNGLNVDICPTSLFAHILSWGTPDQYPPVEPDIYVDTAQNYLIENWDIEIEVLPGHTPGSLVIYIDSIAFVGDLIRGKPLNRDQPARHYFMCDVRDNDQDIEYLLSKEHLTKWYPGHFGPLMVDEVKAWAGREL